MKIKIKDKRLYIAIKSTIIITILTMLWNVIPYLLNIINLILELYKMSNTSPEFKIILLCITFYITCSVITLILKALDVFSSSFKHEEERQREDFELQD